MRVLGSNETLTFDLYSVFNMDTTTDFVVRLMSPLGREYDSVNVIVDTIDHGVAYSEDLLQKNDGTSYTNP